MGLGYQIYNPSPDANLVNGTECIMEIITLPKNINQERLGIENRIINAKPEILDQFMELVKTGSDK